MINRCTQCNIKLMGKYSNRSKFCSIKCSSKFFNTNDANIEDIGKVYNFYKKILKK